MEAESLCETNVVIAKDIPFQSKFNLSDGLATMVGDMNINVDAGTADPHLSMQTGCNANNFKSVFARLDPLVRGSQGTGKRHERFLGCSIISQWLGSCGV